jgi:hypothetical protein
MINMQQVVFSADVSVSTISFTNYLANVTQLFKNVTQLFKNLTRLFENLTQVF